MSTPTQADLFAATHVAQPEDVGTLDRRSSARAGGDPLEALGLLREAGVLRDVDVHFARTVARLAHVDDPHVLLGLAAASRAPGAGHVCAELDAPGRLVRLERAGTAVAWPAPDAWRAALLASPVVATGGAGDDTPCPLVLDGNRAPKFGPRQRVLPMHRW